MKKNRSTLKDYFKKGAIPTESNFADLIDSMLNQEEDSITKLPNDPLKITAIGVDEALVNFYRSENNAEKLSWQIKQKPDGKSGLNISDTAASRLFIENATGNVGIGTTTPKAKLQVLGGAIMPDAGNSESAGVLFPPDPGGGGSDRAWMRYYVRSGEKMTLELGTSNDNDDHIALMPSGSVGIGSNTPIAKLDVLAEARTGTHPTAVKGLYVTGAFGDSSDGVEFRNSNGTQGIGFGNTTIYAAGSTANQDLGLKPRGNGKVSVAGPMQVTGTLQVTGAQIQLDGAQKIAFTDSDTSNNIKLQLWTGYGLGINGGTLFYAAEGNHSWRDKSGTNERMLLTTTADGGLTVKGTGNSSVAGNLGIGTTTPKQKLDVQGRINVENGVIQRGGDAITATNDLGLYSGVEKNYIRLVTNNAPIRLYTDGGMGTNAELSVERGLVNVTGKLQVDGAQNIIKVKTFTLALANAAKDKANTWSVDYSDLKLTEVYAVFANLQGFSAWNNDTNFSNWGHVKSDEAIVQHAFVRVTSSDLKTAKGTCYCSESKAENETDNSVLFTVVVMGRN